MNARQIYHRPAQADAVPFERQNVFWVYPFVLALRQLGQILIKERIFRKGERINLAKKKVTHLYEMMLQAIIMGKMTRKTEGHILTFPGISILITRFNYEE